MLNWNVVWSLGLVLQSISCITSQYAYSAAPLFQKTYIRIQKEIEMQVLKRNLDARTVLNLFSSRPPKQLKGGSNMVHS
jgi:hypothetical protein